MGFAGEAGYKHRLVDACFGFCLRGFLRFLTERPFWESV